MPEAVFQGSSSTLKAMRYGSTPTAVVGAVDSEIAEADAGPPPGPSRWRRRSWVILGVVVVLALAALAWSAVHGSSKPSVNVYQGMSSHPMRSCRPRISAWGARDTYANVVFRAFKWAGCATWSAPKEQPTQARRGYEPPPTIATSEIV